MSHSPLLSYLNKEASIFLQNLIQTSNVLLIYGIGSKELFLSFPKCVVKVLLLEKPLAICKYNTSNVFQHDMVLFHFNEIEHTLDKIVHISLSHFISLSEAKMSCPMVYLIHKVISTYYYFPGR